MSENISTNCRRSLPWVQVLTRACALPHTGAIVLLLLLIASAVPLLPACAGAPTEQEIRASQAFAVQLRRARIGVQKGNLRAVGSALREAMRVGSWSLSENDISELDDVASRPVKERFLKVTSIRTRSRCSVPFFNIPLWALVAQVPAKPRVN